MKVVRIILTSAISITCLLVILYFVVREEYRQRGWVAQEKLRSATTFAHPGEKKIQEVDSSLGVFSYGHGILSICPGKWTQAAAGSAARQQKTLENLATFLVARGDLRVVSMLWGVDENLIFIVERK